MKLSDYKRDFYEFSGKASDVARSAAFAGIALIWLFRIESKPVAKLPNDLLLPTGLFVAALGCDLLQYITGSVIWGSFHWYHERRLAKPSSDPEMHHPSWLSWPIHGLFLLKMLFVVVGYVLVGAFVRSEWLKTFVR